MAKSDIKNKILLVEDDLNLGFLVSEHLESEGFEVKLARDGELALKTFNSGAFDLCLLDVMLPKKDGFSLANQIRALDKNMPFIFITAKSMKEDKIKGFDVGADDYITKPFDEDELVRRIKVILRRTYRAKEEKPQEFSLGRYLFDYRNQALTLDGNTKTMTERESELLHYLCANKNILIKREELLKAVWGENDYFLGRSMDVFITKIRKYLKDDSSISIENVHKVGFIFKVI